MTRRDQFIKSRAWLKMHNFIITQSLREKLKSLPEDDWTKYCFIQNQVIIHAQEYENEISRIHSDTWKSKMGNVYQQVIKDLESWHELEVKYDEIPSRDKTGRTRGYAIPPKAMESGTVVIDLKRKRIQIGRAHV